MTTPYDLYVGIEERITNAVHLALATDDDLVAFFGEGGVVRSPVASSGSSVPHVPYLEVGRDGSADQRVMGQTADVTVPLLVKGYFHPEVAFDPALTPPAVLGLGAKVAGVLTGAFRWMVTIADDQGESSVLEIQGRPQATAEATLSSEAQTLTGLPTGVDVLIYRVEADGQRYRLRAFFPANASAEWVDGEDETSADSELGQEGPPFVSGAAAVWMNIVKLVLHRATARGLREPSGVDISLPGVGLTERVTAVDARNLLVYELATKITTSVNLETRAP